jgi:acyl-CoA synthetase (AMP-forming)/AMP-acid ligase II
MASVGRPLIDCEVKLIDESGAQVATGEVGEVVVRSDRVTPRYWGQDASPVDAQGFYHTGDLARADDDGYITIVDRAKDMIVSGGLNIYSREVEDVLNRHPAVAEAYVLGVPDETWGESVKAVVVLRHGADLTANEAREWCRGHLASYKKPSTVVFAAAEQLPRTSLGKVIKRALRAL